MGKFTVLFAEKFSSAAVSHWRAAKPLLSLQEKKISQRVPRSDASNLKAERSEPNQRNCARRDVNYSASPLSGGSGSRVSLGFLARLFLGRGLTSTFRSRSPSNFGGESAW